MKRVDDQPANQASARPSDSVEALHFERDLQQRVCSDLSAIEPGLKPYDLHAAGGREFRTEDAGRIDILAIDAQGNLVVLELKAGEADDRVLGQLLRYMGWIEQNVAQGRSVRGIIVAHSFREGLKYGVSVLPKVELVRYEVAFSFSKCQS